MDLTERMRQGMVPFRYERPDEETRAGRKATIIMPGIDHLHAHVQVVGDGGETNLHSHPKTDGWWFVLAGRARFYGEDDSEPIGVLGQHEGVLVPRGTKYWFERDGDELLEILHIAITQPDTDIATDRRNHRPLTTAVKESFVLEA
jgi:mannose-6-phosphate isomerase-like protein (cupin superfamily)